MAWMSAKNVAFLLLLLSADLMFVLVGTAHSYTGFGTAHFSLGRDFGHAEVFQYIKFFWISALLLAAFLGSRRSIYLCWAVLFSFLLLDDSIQFHERFGNFLSHRLEFPAIPGLRAQDFGELLASALFGTVLLSAIGISHLRSDAKGRHTSITLLILLGILIAFGVGVDMIHSAAGGVWNKPLGIIEDGGEMFAVSLTCWYTLSVAQSFRLKEKLKPAPVQAFGMAGKRAG